MNSNALKSFLRSSFIACLAVVGLAACDEFWFSSSTSNEFFLEGAVVAGPVAKGKVKVYAANAKGEKTSDLLGEDETEDGSNKGNFRVKIKKPANGNGVVLEVEGGKYISEADKTEQTVGTLTAVLPKLGSQGEKTYVTPVSTLVAERAKARLEKAQDSDLESALNSAQSDIGTALGLALDKPVTAVEPDFTKATNNGGKLGVVLGVLEQLRKNTGYTPATLVTMLAKDLADGKADGKADGVAVVVNTVTTPTTLASSQLSGAANDYSTSSTTVHAENQVTVTEQTGSTNSAAVVAASASGEVTGSSGAIAPLKVLVNGVERTYVYFAARTAGLIRVDMTDPASPVLDKLAPLNAQIVSNGAVGTSVDGVVPIPTPINGAPYLLLYSYEAQKIMLINAADNTVGGARDLGAEIPQMASFSGGSAYIAGGIADGKRNRVWLATKGGLLGIDPTNLASATEMIALPSGYSIQENIGGDPASDVIFNPDYESRVGAVMFQLAERKAYVMDSAAWCSLPGNCSSYEHPDQAALDTSYKVAVIANGGASKTGVMAYSTPSGATGATGTFSASKYVLIPSPSGINDNLTAAAVEPGSHLVLLSNADGGSMAVARIQDPSQPNWTGFSTFKAYRGANQGGAGDPHAIGAFKVGGKPLGFILDSDYSSGDVVIVDLEAFISLPDNNGVLTSNPANELGVIRRLSIPGGISGSGS